MKTDQRADLNRSVPGRSDVQPSGNGGIEYTHPFLSGRDDVDVESDTVEDRADNIVAGDVSEDAVAASGEVFEDSSVRPSRNSYVKYQLKNDDDWYMAKVLSYQPKQTG